MAAHNARSGSGAGGAVAPPTRPRLRLGTVLVLAGIFILGDVVVEALFDLTFIGVVAIVAGTFEVVHALLTRRWGGFAWQIALGVLYVAAGMALVSQPLSDLKLIYFIGLVLLLSGIVRVLLSFTHWRDGTWMMLLSGLFGSVAGLFMLSGFPRTTFWLLGLLLGIDLISHGVAWLTDRWPLSVGTGRPSATPGHPPGRNRP